MRLSIQSRSGRELIPGGLELPSAATVDDLKKAFYQQKRKYYASRQRFSLPPTTGSSRGTALEEGKKLSDYSLTDGSVLLFKDLGPQIGYTTVFIFEYFGPLAVYALFYFFPAAFYGAKQTSQHHPVQTLALAYWSFHYIKRILETLFVHRFSHGTMPIFNLFKNCSYYWGFAAYVSYFVNHPLYTPLQFGTLQAATQLFAAMICQAVNFKCHCMLAALRPPGSREYKLPRGFLFDYITCPNYTAEIVGWLLFFGATQTLPVLFFALAGAGQMAIWAKAKHRRLHKLFDGKDGRPKYSNDIAILIPGVW